VESSYRETPNPGSPKQAGGYFSSGPEREVSERLEPRQNYAVRRTQKPTRTKRARWTINYFLAVDPTLPRGPRVVGPTTHWTPVLIKAWMTRNKGSSPRVGGRSLHYAIRQVQAQCGRRHWFAILFCPPKAGRWTSYTSRTYASEATGGSRQVFYIFNASCIVFPGRFTNNFHA